MSQQTALERIKEAKETGATELDLSYLGLKEIPPEIGGLPNLTSLRLSSNQISEIKHLEALVNLTELNLSSNQISEIKHLEALVNLTSLSLSSNQISEIKELDALVNLTELYLRDNEIIEIKNLDTLVNIKILFFNGNQILKIENLDSLISLEKLTVARNQISEFSGLDQLINLKELVASKNQISEIKNLDKLVNLTSLRLESNQITEIKNLETLAKLQKLHLHLNQISELKNLDALVNLTELRLDSNQISELKNLEALVNLTSLSLSSNQISEIKNLEALVNLTELSLSSNQIREIKHLDKLVNLKKLGLDQNELKVYSSLLLSSKLPVEYALFEDVSYKNEIITIGNNPFVKPPVEIVQEGKEAIKNYYQQLEEHGEEIIHEAKIMIVGEPGSGKTTLMKKLFDRNYPIPNKKEDSTVGIVVTNNWPIKLDQVGIETDYSGHIWDFGGQQIQYMLHQFFLTTDCVYILMSDKRKEITNFDYWLNVISIMGKNSPLIILFNEINIGSGGGADYVFDQKKYRETFPELTINDPLKVDFSKMDNRFDVLVDTIQEKLIGLNHVGHVVPANWLQVKEALAAQVEKRYISIDDFFGICEQYGIKKESFQKQILRYFHLLGIVLHFDNDPNLEDTIFLDPNWTVDAVYTILTHDKIIARNGKFDRKEVYAIWKKKKHKQGDCTKLFRLMLKDNFDLCYKLEASKDQYIFPILLPKVQPDYDWNEKDCLQFRYQYKFRPKGIVSRLIVRMNEHLEEGHVWQEGAVLENKKEKVRAQVREAETEEDGNKIIDISVTGNIHFRKEFLALIRNEIEKIQKKAFPNLKYKEMVPCNCSECPGSADKEFYEYETLKKYLSKRRTTIECRNSLDRVNILKLLGAVYGPDIKEVKKQIKAGKIKEALKQLEQFEGVLDSELFKEITVQYSRFSHTRREGRHGTLTKESEGVELNKIARGLLDLLEEV